MDSDKIVLIIKNRLQKRKEQFQTEWDLCKQPYDQPFWECKFLKPVIDELEEILKEIENK